MKLKESPFDNPVNFCSMGLNARHEFDYPENILPGLPPQISNVGSTGTVIIAGTDGIRRLNLQVRYVIGEELYIYVWTEEEDPDFWPATPRQAEVSGWEIIHGALGRILAEDYE